MNYTKKGEINTNVAAITTLITGVGVAVLVLIFVGSLAGQTYNLVEEDLTVIGRTSITGDAFLAKNGSMNTVSLDHSNIYAGTLSVSNGTNAVSVGPGNYTVDLTAGTIYLKTTTWNNTNLNAAYQYQDFSVQDSIRNGAVKGFNALEQTGSYLPIIVLAIVITMVLFLVMGMTSNKGGGNSAL